MTAEMPTTKKVEHKMEHECTGVDSETVRFGEVFSFCSTLGCAWSHST